MPKQFYLPNPIDNSDANVFYRSQKIFVGNEVPEGMICQIEQ